MKVEEFSKFVADQQESIDGSKVNWAEMRDEWLRDLDSLHQRIVVYLREYIEAGSITYAFTEVPLTEENIGRYLVKRMDIKIGRQLVYLEPMGTLLIGCRGRVDAVGLAGRAQIMLVNATAKRAADLIEVRVTVGTKAGATFPLPQPKPPISWAWKIVTNTSPREFVDLDKEPFLELLMEIGNA